MRIVRLSEQGPKLLLLKWRKLGTKLERQVFGRQIENFGHQKFANSFTKEKSMAARHQGVVRFDWRWKLVIRRAVLKLQFKDFDRTKIDPLVNWQMSRHSFLSLYLKIIVSCGNVSCVLATSCEILVVSTRFFVAMTTRKAQFRTLQRVTNRFRANHLQLS